MRCMIILQSPQCKRHRTQHHGPTRPRRVRDTSARSRARGPGRRLVVSPTWRPMLGLEQRAGFTKEHWARIKALSRRLATRMADEYAWLRPVADLHNELVERPT